MEERWRVRVRAKTGTVSGETIRVTAEVLDEGVAVFSRPVVVSWAPGQTVDQTTLLAGRALCAALEELLRVVRASIG